MKTIARFLALLLVVMDVAPAIAAASETALMNMEQPIAPPSHPNADAIESNEDALPYDPLCASVRGKFPSNGVGGYRTCDRTYAAIFKRYEEFKKRESLASGQIGTEQTGCSSDQGQAAMVNCQKNALNKGKSAFTELSETMKAAADDLNKKQKEMEKNAISLIKTLPVEKRQVAMKLVQNAGKPDSGVINSNNSRRNVCNNDLQAAGDSAQSFCQFVGAMEEAKYYSQKFRESSTSARNQILKLDNMMNKDDKVSKELKTEPDPAKKDGLLSGMDFKDWLGLGTLGLMGAMGYCSITGKCSPKASTGDELSGLNGNTPQEIGATAPTPASQNNNGTGVGTGNLGSTGTNAANGTLGSGASKPIVTTTPVNPTATVPGGGESSQADSAHNAAFERSLSSVGGSYSPSSGSGNGAAGSGGLGSGGEPGGGAGASSDPSAKPAAENTYGAGSGGGPGAFSLGGSSTDAALKGILNGDTPPGGAPGLDALGATSGTDGNLDLGIGAPGAAAHAQGDSSASDSQSIFLRVRDTHVRCLKRGCVTFGIGKNI